MQSSAVSCSIFFSLPTTNSRPQPHLPGLVLTALQLHPLPQPQTYSTSRAPGSACVRWVAHDTTSKPDARSRKHRTGLIVFTRLTFPACRPAGFPDPGPARLWLPAPRRRNCTHIVGGRRIIPAARVCRQPQCGRLRSNGKAAQRSSASPARQAPLEIQFATSPPIRSGKKLSAAMRDKQHILAISRKHRLGFHADSGFEGQ